MIIAITGGKGGTGKTTITLMMAEKFLNEGKSTLIIDADVECPNVHTFLGIGEKVGSAFISKPVINDSKCIMCNMCVEHCPSHALVSVPGQVPRLVESMCDGCSVCKHVCPVSAIDMKPFPVASIFLNKTSNPNVLTARLDENVEETGGIVDQLIDFSFKLNYDVKIIDTAAGTHCSVIRAIEPSDVVYIVVEATPLGFHDFKIMVELLKEMGKLSQSHVVLNKAGLSVSLENEIVSFANEHGLDIAFKVPYDELLVKRYAKGDIHGEI